MNKVEQCDSDLEALMKSVNAYFCDFAVTWLIGCDELPKSLKAVEEGMFSGAGNSYTELEQTLSIIKDPRKKLEKIYELLTFFMEDVLDVEAVQYLQCTVKIKQFDSGSLCQSSTELMPMLTLESTKNGTNGSSLSNITPSDIKICREIIDKFEKRRVAAPNPYVFYCNVRDYISKYEGTDSEIIVKLQTILNNAAKKCGF